GQRAGFLRLFGELSKLQRNAALLGLGLGVLRLLQALASSLDGSVEARKLAAVRRDRGVDLVEPLPRLGVAGVGIKRDGSTLIGKFGSALDASSTFCFKIGDYGFRFLNLIHQSFSLVLTQCSRVSNHSAVTPSAFPFCAVAKIRRIRSCALSTSSTACRRAGEGSCVSRIAAMTPPNARRISSAALVVSGSSSSSIMIIHL